MLYCYVCVQYLAPEVLRKQPYDNTVDWWCLGSVLYEMLFGLVSSYNKLPVYWSLPNLFFCSVVYFRKQSFLVLNTMYIIKFDNFP